MPSSAPNSMAHLCTRARMWRALFGISVRGEFSSKDEFFRKPLAKKTSGAPTLRIGTIAAFSEKPALPPAAPALVCAVAADRLGIHFIRCADEMNGATVTELESIFGWEGGGMAALYTRAADRKRAALRAMKFMQRSSDGAMCQPRKKIGTKAKNKQQSHMLVKPVVRPRGVEPLLQD